MATATTPPLAQAAFGDLEHELATTRRVLERIPEEHFAWKPHEKSMSLGRLSSHVANLVQWSVMTLQTEGFDLAATPPPLDVPASRAELLGQFDQNVEALRGALGQADEAALRHPWTLRKGERVILSTPRVAVMRTMCLNHMIHHRAQLCVYLRLLDLPVPQVYGPSADEPDF